MASKPKIVINKSMRVQIMKIISDVANQNSLTLKNLLSNDGNHIFKPIRAEAMRILRRDFHLSYKQIGEIFNRGQPTVFKILKTAKPLEKRTKIFNKEGLTLIPLTNDQFAIIDDEDYEFLMQWKWQCSFAGYACRSSKTDKNGKRKTIYMHKLILDVPKGFCSDHANRNKLDNRRNNLRVATPSQNTINCPKRTLATSKYRGVTWDKSSSKWHTEITISVKNKISLGYYFCEKEAARAYNKAALTYHGDFACLNQLS